METLNQKLERAQAQWETKKDYERGAMPEVLEYNKQFRNEHARGTENYCYPYNASIRDFILENENIGPHLLEILDTEIYLSQSQIKRETDETYKKAMLANGWRPLDKSAIDDALEQKKKLQVRATANNDWMTVKIDQVYKPHIFNGTYGLMKPRARTRGYDLNQFDNAFCKLVD